MITGKVIWKSPLKIVSLLDGKHFKQVYYLKDVLGMRVETPEYIYRVAVYDGDIFSFDLVEDVYYHIARYTKTSNTCMNLRDGQIYVEKF